MRVYIRVLLIPIMVALLAAPASAGSFFFSTGDPDGKMATASRPGSTGKIEIESADDFILTTPTRLDSATFTGLLPSGANLSDVVDVRIEIYRVFPNDSTDPPSGNVPTRANSPSDVEFADRSASANTLTFTTGLISSTFTANNSVLNGIFKKPNQTTGGDQAVSGQEVQFSVKFTTPFLLPADHYFFVPQVQLAGADENFFWLSAPKPITGGTGPFTPDLQEWIRNADLDPDWLRVGTDIVGGTTPPTFNASFSLSGQTIPEPTGLMMLALGSAAVLVAARPRRRRPAPPHPPLATPRGSNRE